MLFVGYSFHYLHKHFFLLPHKARWDKSTPTESWEKENTTRKIYYAVSVHFYFLFSPPLHCGPQTLVPAVKISAPPPCILIKSLGFVLFIQHKPSDSWTKKVLSGVLLSSWCAAHVLNYTQFLICPVSQTWVYQAHILAARHHSSPVYAGQVRRTHSRKQDKQMGRLGAGKGQGEQRWRRREGGNGFWNDINEWGGWEVGRQPEEEWLREL